MLIAGGKVARESLWLHVQGGALSMDRGWPGCTDTYFLLAPVEEQTRAAGRAAGHSRSHRDGAMGEMSKGGEGERLAGGGHSKMSWRKVSLEPVWI